MQNLSLIVSVVAFVLIVIAPRHSQFEAASCAVSIVSLFVWLACYVKSGVLWQRKKKVHVRDSHWY